MGFGRYHADASVTLTYICSLDTAIPAVLYPECPEPPEAPPPDDQGRAPSLTGADLERWQKEARAATLGAYLADFYATGPGASATPEEREFLAQLSEPSAVTLFCQRRTRRERHREYCKTGAETHLGELGPDVIRFKLNPLTAPDRATAIGHARETADGLTDYARKYKVARFVLERTLIGAEGWPEFKADKQTRKIAPATFDVFDPDWVIEVGYFILELPSLTEREKKA
jgi:hypothetical protein